MPLGASLFCFINAGLYSKLLNKHISLLGQFSASSAYSIGSSWSFRECGATFRIDLWLMSTHYVSKICLTVRGVISPQAAGNHDNLGKAKGRYDLMFILCGYWRTPCYISLTFDMSNQPLRLCSAISHLSKCLGALHVLMLLSESNRNWPQLLIQTQYTRLRSPFSPAKMSIAQ